MKRYLLSFVVLFISLTDVFAYDPELDWKTIETPHFKLHFESKHRQIADDTVALAEIIHKDLAKKFQWEPRRKTHLVLTDHTDVANGYASPLPFNRSVLFVHPPQAGEMDMKDWLTSLLTHEYTHVLHLDKADGVPDAFRNIFGRFWPLFPNIFQPSWVHEGLATYQETSYENRIGRGQSSIYAMKIQEELRSGFKSISEVNMASSSWPLDARYLYGYYFFQFISETYGKEKVFHLVEEYSDNWLPYFINQNSEKVIGKPLDVLWDEFEDYLMDRYAPIKSEKLQSTLTNDGFFKQGLAQGLEQALWFTGYDGYTQYGLYRVRDNQTEKVHDLNSLGYLDVNLQGELLISQLEVNDEYNLYYDLYIYKPSQQKLQRITFSQRYVEAVWDNKSETIIALKGDSGRFYLERLTREGKFIERLYMGGTEVISYMDISPDSRFIVASVQRPDSSRAGVELFDLESHEWQPLFDKEFHSWHAKFVNDKQIVFSSDRQQNRFDIYLADIQTREVSRIASARSGEFEPIIIDNELWTLQYSSRGFDVVKREHFNTNAPAEITTLDLQYPLNLDEGRQTTRLERKGSLSEAEVMDYSSLDSLTPSYWFPFAVGNENTVELGLQTSGMDALENHSYFLAGSVEIERKLPNLFVNYQYDRFFNLRLQHSHDIDDDDNPLTTDFIEQSTELELSYYIAFTQLQRQWNIELAASFDTTRQYLWQDESLRFIREFNDPLVGVAFNFNSSKNYLRSISPSNGRQIKFATASSDVIESDFTGKRAVIDWRELIQLSGEHVLAIRALAASAEQGGRNFRIGGDFSEPFFMQGNALVEHRYALRGYPDFADVLSGRHVRMTSVEWRFPLGHLERTFMSPPIGIDKVSGRLFFDEARVYGHSQSVIDRYPSLDLSEQHYASVGAELYTRVKLFYSLILDVRLGYAIANDLSVGEEKSYFSIGTSF